MPLRNNSPEPQVMTWGKALPVIVVGAIFDVIRFMCEWLIFFGPAIATLFCTIQVGEKIGTTLGGLACTTAGLAAGVAASGAIEGLGIILAFVTGLAGWLVVGIWVLATNARMIRENFLSVALGFLVTEVPFVGSVPMITIILWRMYHNQIKIERAAHTKWKKEQTEAIAQERKLQAERAYAEAANEAMYEEAANAAVYDETEEEAESPEQLRRAA